jgi:hypothetical protein
MNQDLDVELLETADREVEAMPTLQEDVADYSSATLLGTDMPADDSPTHATGEAPVDPTAFTAELNASTVEYEIMVANADISIDELAEGQGVPTEQMGAAVLSEEELAKLSFEFAAGTLQRFMRCTLARRSAQVRRERAMSVQSKIAKYLEWAATNIQRFVRGDLARKKFKAFVKANEVCSLQYHI